ncbi:MAG: hypothetical protein VX700_09150 [Pseudomonadota bacterium]|nr:hypothetical protein [Pseudomonadota bacterium]
MTVLLRRSDDLPELSAFASWTAIDTEPVEIGEEHRVSDTGRLLENAFAEIGPEWWDIGKSLSQEKTAEFAHTPCAVSNVSDFGQMLAWSRIVQKWASENTTYLVVTDDPWLFRHLSQLNGVVPGRMPSLFTSELRLWLRGYTARLIAAIRFAVSALAMRSQKSGVVTGRAVVMVYGHPASQPTGQDGYFGNLLVGNQSIDRVLHVDCRPRTARYLAGSGQTRSLHAWGNPLAVLPLLWARWRPAAAWRKSSQNWLIRRAARREASTATGAAIAWQRHCQGKWLSATLPKSVAWPWENHSWERIFVQQCRAEQVTTVGYQHSVIGHNMLNYAAHSNPDGASGIPDLVLATGEVTFSHLVNWGIPSKRLSIGGAWRYVPSATPKIDPSAPVFLALPFDERISAEMIGAARAVNQHSFLVKSHPMTPYRFTESENIRCTNASLSEQSAVSAVVYAASSVGLESVLAGIPTFRYRPRSYLALDILPEGITLPVVDADSLGEALDCPTSSTATICRRRVFAEPDTAEWHHYLKADT